MMKQRLRQIIVGLMLLAAAWLLVKGPRPDAQLPKGRVVVQYWEKWTGTEEKQMQEIVDDFNNSVGVEKNIFVRYLSMSSINQKTLVATAAGVPPDIAGIWDAQLLQFAALDALEPLEDLARERGIGEGFYKRVYWEGLNYNGHLWGLMSTPAAVALHYNKRMFHDGAPALRAAGLDPDRPPRSIEELDRYADALNVFDPDHPGRLVHAGYLPSEPGWYMAYQSYWFGGNLFDEATGRFTFTEPANVRAYEWVQKYSRKLGREAITDFRSGFGSFNTTQNAFLVGKVAMEQQGPWMANYIYNLQPKMSEVNVPRSQEFSLPDRRENYEWAVAAFPSAVPGLQDVSVCDFDLLAIPRGAKHKREAFEYIAYVNRQEVMEKLCALHCKNSPLAQVSEKFIKTHPNPYIDVFERLSSSPNARGVPKVPIWPQVSDELGVMAQSVISLQSEPGPALAEAQQRMQAKYDSFLRKQKARAALQ